MGVVETISRQAATVCTAAIRVADSPAEQVRLWPSRVPLTGTTRADRAPVQTVRADGSGLVSMTAQEGHLLLIVPSGPVRILGEGVSVPLDEGSVALLARSGQIDVHHHGPLAMTVARIPRVIWQESATSRFEEPVRLSQALTVVTQTPAELAALVLSGGLLADAGNSGGMIASSLCETLIDALDEIEPRGEIWETVRSLKRATDFILGNPGAACSCEFVADHAGMTARTLQRQALAWLGMPLSKFIRDARLTAAYHSLSTACDSRPVARLAIDYGFASGGSFTRTYGRRYGETPTQTRLRAVNAQE